MTTVPTLGPGQPHTGVTIISSVLAQASARCLHSAKHGSHPPCHPILRLSSDCLAEAEADLAEWDLIHCIITFGSDSPWAGF